MRNLTVRLRRATVFGLAVLSVVGIVASTLALWTRSTLFGNARFERTVELILAEPAVTDALAAFAANETLAAVDLSGKVGSILPDELQVLEPALVGGARMLLESQLRKALADPAVRRVVTDLAVASHAELLRLLEGNGLGSGITVADGAVTLNLLPLIGQGLAILQDRRLIPRFALPDLSGAETATAVGQLSQLVGRQLPDDFGQIVVYRSEAVAAAEAGLNAAQRAVAVFVRAVTAIIAVTVVLLAAALALSPDRRTTVLTLGTGLAVAVVAAHAGVERVIRTVPDLLNDPGARVAAGVAAADLTAGLLRAFDGLLVIGVVVASGIRVPQLIRLGRPDGTVRQVLRSHGAALAVVAYALALLAIGRFGLYLQPVVLAAVITAGGVVLQIRSDRVPRSGGRPLRR